MNDVKEFFNTLNQYFDHIYVITLQRASDRHTHLRNELNGLNYELFFGKDNQQFNIEELKKQKIYDEANAKKMHRYHKPMHSGQIGCSWSHAEVYKDVIEKKFERVLILEDDIVINKAKVHFLPQILKQLPDDWELIYFGFDKKEVIKKGSFLKKWFYHFIRLFKGINYSHTTIKNLFPQKISEHIYKAGYHDCTHAYAVTFSAAEKLLQLQQPIIFIADNLLSHAVTNEMVKGYIVLPKLIDQQFQVQADYKSYVNQ